MQGQLQLLLPRPVLPPLLLHPPQPQRTLHLSGTWLSPRQSAALSFLFFLGPIVTLQRTYLGSNFSIAAAAQLARAAGSTVACPVCFTSWVVPPASGSPGAPPAVITAVAAVAPVAVAVSGQPTSPIAAAGAPGPTAASPSTAAAADVANGQQQQQPADADASVSGDVKQEPAGEEKTEEGEKKKVEVEMEMEMEKQPEGEIAEAKQ